ncbi:MAG: Hsp33 family molecular chaperone HslO [Erysipelothrix sp.]|nr:Hsp33 family molecular chaperone HslO [Erysipelothrix sp.]
MDKLAIGMARNNNVRIYATTTTALVEEARVRHDMWPTATAALGRVMSVALMMASMQKGKDEKLTIQINGDGMLKTILATAQNDGSVRGYVGDPHVMLSYNDTNKLAVGTAIGNGYLRVIKDMNLKNEFVGTVDLQTGEIGEDFAFYFTVSEQTPSAVSVGVLVDTDNSVLASGGLIIQLMPGASEEDILATEQVLANLKPISEIVQQGKTASEIIEDLFEDAQVLLEKEVFFKCDCSKDRMLNGLRTLENDEIKAMIDDGETIETVCNFCNEKYEFSLEDLQGLLDDKINQNR